MNEYINANDKNTTEDCISYISEDLTEAAYERYTIGEISLEELQSTYEALRRLNENNLRKLHKT